MLENDWLIVLGMGAIFILLGVVTFFFGRGEEKSYYDSITARSDLREFVEHSPQQPEPQGLRIGGWIAIAVGLLMAAIAVFVMR